MIPDWPLVVWRVLLFLHNYDQMGVKVAGGTWKCDQWKTTNTVPTQPIHQQQKTMVVDIGKYHATTRDTSCLVIKQLVAVARLALAARTFGMKLSCD